MNKMFKKYRAMSFAEKVQYIKYRQAVIKPWIEPTAQQEGLF
jgi:hypothetical protein